MDSVYLVSDETCKGCVHYGRIVPDTPCCCYAIDTEKLRPRGEPPCKCSVKVLGGRRKYTHSRVTRGLFEGGKIVSTLSLDSQWI